MSGIRGPASASDAERPVARPLLVLREISAPGPRVFGLVDLAADPQAPLAATAVVCPIDDFTAEVQAMGTGTALPMDVVVRSLVVGLADVLRTSGYRRLLVTVRSDDAERLAAVQVGGFSPLADQGASAEVVRLALSLCALQGSLKKPPRLIGATPSSQSEASVACLAARQHAPSPLQAVSNRPGGRWRSWIYDWEGP